MRGRPPNLIPNEEMCVSIPQDLYVKLKLELFSPLEGRVPHGAYKRFFIELLTAHFKNERLDLAPWAASPPSAFVVEGTPEAISALTNTLTKGTPHV